MNTIDSLLQAGDPGISLKRQLEDQLIEHTRHVETFAADLPETRNRCWGGTA